MKTLTLVAGVALATLLGSSAFAGDVDPAAVRTASEVCSKCHGPSGVSNSPLFPMLAGQPAGYIEQELKAFREHGRGDPHARAYMWGIAGPLTDAQIKGLADYYSSRKAPKGEPAENPQLAAEGKTLFFSGNQARNIPACVDCHGKQAEGNDTVPRLAGQARDYLISQMEEFRSTLRENETMHANTEGMTNDDIKALAEYLSSL